MKPPYPITEGWQSQNGSIDRYTIIGNVDGDYENGVLRYSYTPVCEVSEGHDDAEGNLRLILAAPAMLKELKQTIDDLVGLAKEIQPWGSEAWHSAMRIRRRATELRATVDKAEGRS